MNIHSIWDNNGETLDRYTIVLNSFHDRAETLNECLALSENALGISEFSSCQPGKHLGKKLKFEELPKNIQAHIKSRLEG